MKEMIRLIKKNFLIEIITKNLLLGSGQPLFFLDCSNPGAFNWIGDGYCNHQNNNAYCSYDGGDCCGENVNMFFCNPNSGLCQCIIGDTNHGECPNPGWIGDGYCDDVTNNQYCNYDGGDCCGAAINTQYCSECQCLN